MAASTDIRSLNSALQQIEHQLDELKLAFCTRYAPKQQQRELKSQLNWLVSRSDMVQAEVESLCAKERRLRRMVKNANIYVEERPPDQTIRDVVLKALHSDDNDGIY